VCVCVCISARKSSRGPACVHARACTRMCGCVNERVRVYVCVHVCVSAPRRTRASTVGSRERFVVSSQRKRGHSRRVQEWLQQRTDNVLVGLAALQELHPAVDDERRKLVQEVRGTRETRLYCFVKRGVVHVDVVVANEPQ